MQSASPPRELCQGSFFALAQHPRCLLLPPLKRLRPSGRCHRCRWRCQGARSVGELRLCELLRLGARLQQLGLVLQQRWRGGDHASSRRRRVSLSACSRLLPDPVPNGSNCLWPLSGVHGTSVCSGGHPARALRSRRILPTCSTRVGTTRGRCVCSGGRGHRRPAAPLRQARRAAVGVRGGDHSPVPRSAQLLHVVKPLAQKRAAIRPVCGRVRGRQSDIAAAQPGRHDERAATPAHPYSHG